MHVPANQIVGKEGDGWAVVNVLAGFEKSNVGLVYGLLSAIERLVEYCNETKRNGVPLSRNPIVRNRLADLAIGLEAVRTLAMRIADQQSRNEMGLMDAAAVKVFASELMEKMANMATTLFGPEKGGDELPEELGRRAERLKQLQEAKSRLEKESEAAAREVREHLVQRQAEEAASDKKKRGRKPKMIEPALVEQAKANLTDPDSRIMKARQGYVQGYNAQAIVSQDQVIVATGVIQETNDVQQLKPMLQTLEPS